MDTEVGRGVDARVTEDDVEALFEAVLRRPVRNDAYRRQLVEQGLTIRQMLLGLRNCDELRTAMRSAILEQ